MKSEQYVHCTIRKSVYEDHVPVVQRRCYHFFTVRSRLFWVL